MLSVASSLVVHQHTRLLLHLAQPFRDFLTRRIVDTSTKYLGMDVGNLEYTAWTR